VSHPKTINIKLYLITNNFSVNNRHFVIKSSQATQLYIAIQGTEGKCSCILTAVTSNICYIIF
jgi:hypothetical protein